MIKLVIGARNVHDGQAVASYLDSDESLHVLAVTTSGRETVEAVVRLSPDLVLLDAAVRHPGAAEVTRRIMADAPLPVLILLASDADRPTAQAQDAVAAGALLTATVSRRGSRPVQDGSLAALAKLIRSMGGMRVVRRRPGPTLVANPVVTARPARSVPWDTNRVVVLAASTGGPAALRTVLARVPRDLPASILVVQHMAPTFVDAFARWLRGSTSLPVRVARDGEPLEPGTVYLAPDDRHLGVHAGGVIRLSDAAAIDGFRPSATHLFESAARECRAAVVAVLLTGMGRDGVTGLRAVRDAGGTTIAQDEASSVVFGMPGEAVRAGVVQEVLSVDRIGERITQLVSGGFDAP